MYEGEFNAKVKTPYGHTSLHNQSHGESFISLIQNRFSERGIYLLDEPEAALSPSRIFLLTTLINELVKNNSQFIIATHSPILMAYPDCEILQLSQSGISSVNYKQTEHYKLTKSFFDNPERMMHYLLNE